ncbi:MAG: FkbM family methyltransferase [Gemmatimonadetes bacterium]|nr:FkbM family methyltransferase [Gemmatimonadota bacterium]
MTAGVRKVLGPVVRAIVGLLPERYRLPYQVARLRMANGLEPEIFLLDSFTDRRELALDVGANLGYYTYHLAKLFGRVVAFEPNPAVASSLRAWGAPNVEIHTAALSSAPGDVDLFVPIVNGVRQPGWASFDRNNLAGASDFEVIRVATRTLDSYGFRDVSFIKMDVEGHEPAVLQGARETIRASRPVVLVEVKELNRDLVFGFFDALGYSPFQVREGKLVPVVEPSGVEAPGGENYVFRPS